MIKYELPKNIPDNKKDKYITILKKNYVPYLEFINKIGGYIALNQFVIIYEMNNSSLSSSYARKKATAIIKELEALSFVKILTLNRHKYITLKNASNHILSGDYKNNLKHSNASLLKNDKFTTSLIKAQYFIENKTFITYSNMYKHLTVITNDIYKAKLADPSLEYDIELLKAILKETDVKKISSLVEDLPYSNLLRILWVDIYTIFSKLHLQNQTILQNPLYYRLYKRNSTLKLHYAPTIVIWDSHDSSYYKKKITVLFEFFNRISGNNTTDMQKSFLTKKNLGFEGYNHIGYSVMLIGYNENVLKSKCKYINSFIKDNPKAAIVDYTQYIHLDISKYLSTTVKDTTITDNIDTYIDTKVFSKLSEILNS